MGEYYLRGLGVSIDLPKDHTYSELGWVSDLEGSVNRHWQHYARKVEREERSYKSYVGGVTSTGCYRTKSGRECHTATAFQNYRGMSSLYRNSVTSHEEVHVADHTGNIGRVERALQLNLRGKSSEDKANLGMLARLEQKGYNLEKVLHSRKNRRGMVVTDSTKRPDAGVQLGYHNYIVGEYGRQKKTRKVRANLRSKARKKGKSSKR